MNSFLPPVCTDRNISLKVNIFSEKIAQAAKMNGFAFCTPHPIFQWGLSGKEGNPQHRRGTLHRAQKGWWLVSQSLPASLRLIGNNGVPQTFILLGQEDAGGGGMGVRLRRDTQHLSFLPSTSTACGVLTHCLAMETPTLRRRRALRTPELG